jgi:hypothetical protein
MDMDFKWTTRAEKLLVIDYWWREQRGCCCLCADLMLPYRRQHTKTGMAATVEHLKPKRDGGPDTAGNVRLAHMVCNNALGALWEQNKQRAARGLPPITDDWAIENAKGRKKHHVPLPPFRDDAVHTKESAFYSKWIEWKKAKVGVTWNAGNAVSLPRGATLLPEYQDRVGKYLNNRVARKMNPIETARWLAEQGVRGA